MDTIFNPNQYNYTTISNWSNLSITEARINEALANLTLTTMIALQQWNTTVPVKIEEALTFSSFAARKNLLIPYFLCLAVATPYLILGAISMCRNGVSAVPGGFIQVLMTTTGSKILEQMAASGCLRGDENVPKDLLDLKIRFGELVGIGDQAGGVRRAGFETDNEIVPLDRRAVYGIREVKEKDT